MILLLLGLSARAEKVDVVAAVPFGSGPFTYYTLDSGMGNVNPTRTYVDGSSGFRGDLGAAFQLHPIGTTHRWVLDTGLQLWRGGFDAEGGEVPIDVAVARPRADVGIQLGALPKADEPVQAYLGLGVGLELAILTSPIFSTIATPSLHSFLSGGVAVGKGTHKALVELRVSPIARSDYYAGEVQLASTRAGFEFKPGGVVVSLGAGARFL